MHIPSGLEPLQQEAENDAPSDKKNSQHEVGYCI